MRGREEERKRKRRNETEELGTLLSPGLCSTHELRQTQI